jgi:hypothetical protein
MPQKVEIVKQVKQSVISPAFAGFFMSYQKYIKTIQLNILQTRKEKLHFFPLRGTL